MASKPAATEVAHKDVAKKEKTRDYIMPSVFVASVALLAGVLVNGYVSPPAYGSKASREQIPDQAQIIDQKAFNVLPSVLPPSEANATTVGRHLSHMP